MRSDTITTEAIISYVDKLIERSNDIYKMLLEGLITWKGDNSANYNKIII